ncbi:hypothetical protein PULV_a2624 [Pseudoalteromonas ulvae UL12]|uniref:Uncharacterized protein n=2 Tax=Pseudoalteromonas ulvae TaxID=107327 RepID=A0A244CPF0_PSEDV|nr:hypothetical protein [Pseudoalteromonas ulvae UL12]OUL57366.1 hypothetical protein B1199_14470 [Pseudoalteromonas ulvae]
MPHSTEFLANSQFYSVDEQAEFWHEDKMNVAIGPYRVSNMNIGWQTSSEDGTRALINDLGYNQQTTQSEQAFSYQFTGPDGTSSVQCVQNTSEYEQSWTINKGFSLPLNFNASFSYACQFQQEKIQWQLLVLADNFGKVSYQLHNNQGDTFTINALNHNQLPLPQRSFIGFEFYDQQKIAAISMNNPAELWLLNDLPAAKQQVVFISLLNLWYMKHALQAH